MLCLLTLLPLALAQEMDPQFAKSQKEWTTRPEFSSPLVDHLPKSSSVPSPKDVLGYYIGAPKKLTYYGDILKYYRALAAKSPRVKVIETGKSDEGRDCVVVIIADDDTMKNIETYRGIPRATRRSAQPNRRAGLRDHRQGQAHLPPDGRPA